MASFTSSSQSDLDSDLKSNINVVIVEKSGSLKSLCIKSFVEGDLYKKCGFKTKDNFKKYDSWKVKSKDLIYIVTLYGKDVGKANSENKYDFPPPHDNILFFGNCVLVLHTSYKGEKKEKLPPILESLSVELWETLYEKLFGGFEDLTSTAMEDETEIDELENVPASKKTKKGGYLKDGFVVSDDENENEESGYDEDEDEDEDEDDSENTSEYDGSELTEDSYIAT